MKNAEELLMGGDLRSTGKVNEIVRGVYGQNEFDSVFKALFHPDRKVVMRAADAVEKITLDKHDWLEKHKNEILQLCFQAKHIELKWHLALLVSRLKLTGEETGIVWELLTGWATDKNESRIVRVNSIQGLFNILQSNRKLELDFNQTISRVTEENIPSLNARIRKIQKRQP